MDKRKRHLIGPQRSKLTPVRSAPSANRRKSTPSVPTMDKNNMLVMEANEIVHLLNRHFVFEMKEEVAGDDSRTQVRVRNTESKRVCVWTLAKLKERLVKMRKLMYADEAEGQGIGGDTVFFDAADVWIPEDEDIQSTAHAPSPQHKDKQSDNHSNPAKDTDTSQGRDNKIINGHSSHSNQMGQDSNIGMTTLSNEEALPSVSVSVAFESTQNTVKLPNGLPAPKAMGQANGLSSTTSSELPADSEFLGMSLTSSLSSPMSPPPPPKDFGQNSNGSNRAEDPRRASGGGILPEKYLTSSPAQAHTSSAVRFSPTGGAFKQTGNEKLQSQSAHSTETEQPLTQANHRPIIKSRSPNVAATAGAVRNSRKMKPRENAISFNMDSETNPLSLSGSHVRDNIQSKDDRQMKGVPKNLAHTLNYPQPANSRTSPNVIKRELPSGDQVDNIKHQHSPDKSHNPSPYNEQRSVCQHCKGATDVSRDFRVPKRNKRTISALRMCRDMVKTLTHRCKGPPRSDTFVDRVMYNCESVKIAVINILEAYTQAQDSQHDMATFADSELVKLASMQLVSSMELLVTHTSLWSTSRNGEETEFVTDASARINNTVKDLGKEMVLFLQACETDNDTLASESATKIIDQLYDLIKMCGELAIATDTCPLLLMERRKRSSIDELLALKHNREDDLLNIKPSSDMKQSFLGGCDVLLEQCIESGIKTVQDCELRAQMLSEDCYASQESGTEVAKHAYIVTTTCKILLLKCKELQVDISASMKEETTKEDTYFHQYFLRCQGMVQQVAALASSVSLLCQASEPLADEEDPSTLKKISRCSELIFRATNKLIISSNFDLSHSNIPDTPRSLSSLNGITLDMRTDDMELSSVVTDSQCDQLDHCGEDVKLATQALCAIVRRHLPSNENSTGSKVKRMLPATPGVASSSRPMMRCKSAKHPERMRRSVSYYDVNGKKSNEV